VVGALDEGAERVAAGVSNQPQQQLQMRIAGDTNVGKVRTTNEDSMIVDHQLRLYVVLDGMGGANAGDLASQTARDAIGMFVQHQRLTMEPKQLLEAAIQYGSAAVFNAAQQARERHGMGTTCVACMIIDAKRAVVAHVGDSRAYLLRHGRLQSLTRDHTIVEELVDRGVLAADEAERHPYKNVLSRNLGARPETRVDVLELEIKPGDRIMLCSDGLYGYASNDGMQYLLGSGDPPETVARDLIDLALRGGGGDNVSVIVIEAPQPAPTSTQVVRTSGATAWWQHRKRFLQIAKDRGITKNAICRGLKPDEALDLVASSLCEAIFHDLEKSTGVNVWTFAQNIAGGWFERGGQWQPLRDLMDILAVSARACVDDIRKTDAKLGFLLDVAVSRALVVAELALGGLLAERLRHVDHDLIQIHGAMQETIDGELDRHDTEAPERTSSKFIDQATIPFMRPDRPVTNPGVSAELVTAIEKTLTIARGRTSPRAELVKQILESLETIATDPSGQFASAVIAARELYGVRTVDDAGVTQLFDALDAARIITASSVHQASVPDAMRAKVLRAVSSAHQRLVGAMTGLVLEAVSPYSMRLEEAKVATGELRDKVARTERKRAELERKFASTVDQSMPWERRGTTEW
jgi:serine/threonine protein phosphatase PrpC